MFACAVHCSVLSSVCCVLCSVYCVMLCCLLYFVGLCAVCCVLLCDSVLRWCNDSTLSSSSRVRLLLLLLFKQKYNNFSITGICICPNVIKKTYLNKLNYKKILFSPPAAELESAAGCLSNTNRTSLIHRNLSSPIFTELYTSRWIWSNAKSPNLYIFQNDSSGFMQMLFSLSHTSEVLPIPFKNMQKFNNLPLSSSQKK